MNIALKKHLSLNRFTTILAFAISAFFLFGCNSLPAVSSLFATGTPTATTTFTPTSTPTSTATSTPTATYTPRPTPTATPDQRVLNPANQHLYLYVRERTNWHLARNYCIYEGGHLVTIQSSSENRFVYELDQLSFDNANNSIIWLGATDEIEEGKWVWVTGQPLTYSNWETRPGRNGGVNNPEKSKINADFLTFEGSDKTWDTQPYGYGYFVCEWE